MDGGRWRAGVRAPPSARFLHVEPATDRPQNNPPTARWQMDPATADRTTEPRAARPPLPAPPARADAAGWVSQSAGPPPLADAPSGGRPTAARRPTDRPIVRASGGPAAVLLWAFGGVGQPVADGGLAVPETAAMAVLGDLWVFVATLRVPPTTVFILSELKSTEGVCGCEAWVGVCLTRRRRGRGRRRWSGFSGSTARPR
jgi:hypothetical protein